MIPIPRHVSLRLYKLCCYNLSNMLKPVLITTAVVGVLLLVELLLTLLGQGSLQTEYIEFAVALVMFGVILVGSYWFVVRGSGKDM